MSEFAEAAREFLHIVTMLGFSTAGLIFGLSGKHEKGAFYLLAAIWLRIMHWPT
jgi:hypothetical protein